MMKKKPNIMIILSDDMGYSDLGCYGGEIQTPVLDALAEGGLKFTQFYNSPRCSPTRASLLTGLHPHQTGVGILTENQLPDGYPGSLNQNCVTIAEVLREHGYATYMSGKWHLCSDWFVDKSAWPCQRGFDEFYGIIAGAANYFHPTTLTHNNVSIEHETEDENYYLTDAISDNAVHFINHHAHYEQDDPFFIYVAYTAPHWPLHALHEDIKKYQGCFNEGYEKLCEERFGRMVEMGIIDENQSLSPRDEAEPFWEDIHFKEWEQRRMEVYAAQIDRMDQGIGKIVDSLKENDMFENTLIMFLSDNGACAEVLMPMDEWLVKGHVAKRYTKKGEIVQFGNRPDSMPGDETTYQSYGTAWANLSNTPFRFYKHWTHEGGISTPFIVHWPEGIKDKGQLRHSPAQLTDIMATVLEITGAEYPQEYNGYEIIPYEGQSIVELFDKDQRDRDMLFWEHEGNAAVRDGKWKLVKKYPDSWELYDMEKDRTELNDVSEEFPVQLSDMIVAYHAWAQRCGVIDREKILSYMARKSKRL